MSGWVRNEGGELEIHAQGPSGRVKEFGEALLARVPPAAQVRLVSTRLTAEESLEGFRILASGTDGQSEVHVPLDLCTCDDCLAELGSPTARRFRYPFINCTQCGPRYTVIRSLPYDRPNTTLESFTLCAPCAAEFANPLDRRFHAQPLACARCGPQLEWSAHGERLSGNEPALASAVTALRAGQIVGVRGIGGYHLLCDATDEHAVQRLRTRKGRPDKPLAVMVPWRGLGGLDGVRELAAVSDLEAACLLAPARPVVLLASRPAGAPVEGMGKLAASIAPGLREIGLMLPYSPLHQLLVDDFGGPVVATSGNPSGEPVITEPGEAEGRLSHVADGFLHHDRPIARHADDPVLRVVRSRPRPLRLGRGTAPLELELERPAAVPTLAVGAFAKTTVALAWGRRAVISPHIGELASPRSRAVFANLVEELQQLYGVRAERIAHDAHPGLPSTRYAGEAGLPTHAVWHHRAHASAVAGEFASEIPEHAALLCFTWDGVGLGEDGTLWGGEALLGSPGAWRRVASMRPFRLPGGDRAAREPWRAALGMCTDAGCAWPQGEARGNGLLQRALRGGINAPWTTSVGRMFDAAAALIGICSRTSYEGEAAMRLEALCTVDDEYPALGLPLRRAGKGHWYTDWAPLLPRLLASDATPADRASLFHSSLARTLCDQAIAVRADTGVEHIGLAGGVFQNRVLCERAARQLGKAGFRVFMPRRLPVNDAAISFGQLIESSARQ
jgi:hydrogenase maturation protein HypF